MNDDKHNAVALEEDWSDLIKDAQLHGFAKHASEDIALPTGHVIRLQCVKELTPFDIMRLYNGDHDATGNMVWMGALFFAEAFPHLKNSLFSDRRVLELGSGTGFGGIALLILSSSANCSPQELVMTDGNPASLELCRDNCQLNSQYFDEVSINVRMLDWNEAFSFQGEKFDTIISTDVVYDVAAVNPLLSTVHRYLSPGGSFILSHIPRASLPGASKIASTEEMETYITRAASTYSLQLIETIRPMDLSETTPNNVESILQMHDAGAAILLFTLRN